MIQSVSGAILNFDELGRHAGRTYLVNSNGAIGKSKAISLLFVFLSVFEKEKQDVAQRYEKLKDENMQLKHEMQKYKNLELENKHLKNETIIIGVLIWKLKNVNTLFISYTWVIRN